MKEVLKWFNPNIKMKRWLICIFIGAIVFAYAISNLIIQTELTLISLLITAILFVIGGSLIVIAFIFAQSKTMQVITGVNTLSENLSQEELEKIFRDKTLYERNPKICIIGTGLGLDATIKSVKKYSNNISVITPFYENDIRDSLINLATNKQVIKKLFEDNYLFSQIEYFKKVYGDYELGISNLCNILNLNGSIIPVSYDSMEYKVILSDGIELSSQTDEIAKINMQRGTKISKLFLNQEVNITQTSLNAIKKADLIIFAPCSLYSELIPILKIDNLVKTLKKAKAKKVYINNIMTVSGETTFYDLYDHINAINEICETEFIDYIIVDKGNIAYKKRVDEYNKTSSEPVEYNKEKFKGSKIRVIRKDLAISNRDNDLVYDYDKLSDIIGNILINNIDGNKSKLTKRAIIAKIKNLINKFRK
ncbi:MAG: hypothetical protein E7311_00195 [Clostridiales bacterium]|nr:hypothetical protein [Clostridiales bacterium]